MFDAYTYDFAQHENDADGWGDWEDVEESYGLQVELSNELAHEENHSDDDTLNVGVHDRIWYDGSKGTFCYYDSETGRTRKAF